MINNKHKFIFVHIQKTGGSSIKYALNWDGKKQNGGEHLTVKKYEKMLKDRYKEYFVFTCIRNPWDRMVSHYFHGKRANKFKAKKFNNFNEWIKFYLTKGKKQTVEPQRYFTQYEYLINNQKKVDIDYIMQYENLQNDFDKLCDLLNIERRVLPHKRKSIRRKNKHYSLFYNNKNIYLVERMFKRDIEFFNYNFNDLRN